MIIILGPEINHYNAWRLELWNKNEMTTIWQQALAYLFQPWKTLYHLLVQPFSLEIAVQIFGSIHLFIIMDNYRISYVIASICSRT